jgi:hypothetical protein
MYLNHGSDGLAGIQFSAPFKNHSLPAVGAASFRALLNTFSNISSVSLPVLVFCKEG